MRLEKLDEFKVISTRKRVTLVIIRCFSERKGNYEQIIEYANKSYSANQTGDRRNDFGALLAFISWILTLQDSRRSDRFWYASQQRFYRRWTEHSLRPR